jgi:hypothetical protein
LIAPPKFFRIEEFIQYHTVKVSRIEIVKALIIAHNYFLCE